MPRKKLEDLEAKPAAEKPKAEQMKEMPKYDAEVVTEGIGFNIAPLPLISSMMKSEFASYPVPALEMLRSVIPPA